jgi:hypothetical protein
MSSLKPHAGYLVVDHRDSPGLTPADVAHVPGAIAVGPGSLLERDVLTCSHCQRAVILEPLRVRDRGYCLKCDHYVCDACETIRVKTGACVPMTQTLDRMHALAAHGTIVAHDHLAPPPLTLAVPARLVELNDLIRRAKAAYADEDWDGAEPCFRQLLDVGVSPGATTAALGTIALYQGKRAEALAYAERAVDADPTSQDGYDNLVMYRDADPATTPAEALAIRRRWWDACGVTAYARRVPLTNDRAPDRPLRVGYVSGDFCHHSAASVFGPFALTHSADIEAYFYSSTERPDKITELFSVSPNWRDVFGQTDEAVADQIRRDRIDLLVDLSGYTANNRLGVFARKVAPIQITGWGYGTGLSWPAGVMDYLVADATVIPPAHPDITEQIALLPCVLPYQPATLYPPQPTPLPCLTQPPTFGVLQRALKINDASVQVWRQILERCPESRLIIKGDYCRTFVERLQGLLAPVLDRVSILNVPTAKADHLAMWAHIDVALDTWPQSGGVVSCEALWHGVPMVTLQGERLMSRVASSLLTTLGLTEFIAETPEQYIDCAVSAITHPQRLAEIRQGLPAMYADWIARTKYPQHVEAFYRLAWQTWCRS